MVVRSDDLSVDEYGMVNSAHSARFLQVSPRESRSIAHVHSTEMDAEQHQSRTNKALNFIFYDQRTKRECTQLRPTKKIWTKKCDGNLSFYIFSPAGWRRELQWKEMKYILLKCICDENCYWKKNIISFVSDFSIILLRIFSLNFATRSI